MRTKPRVVKDFDKIDAAIIEQVNKKFPMGFRKHLIKFQDRDGQWIKALPFETDDKNYLIRITNTPKKVVPQEASDNEEDVPDFEEIIAGSDTAMDAFELDSEEE